MFHRFAATARPDDVRVAACSVAVAVSLAIAAAACDTGSLPTSEMPDAGLDADVEATESPNRALARYLALSLNEPDVREGLLTAMQNSPVYEGKILLSADMKGPVNGLLSQMARAGGTTRSRIVDLIESAPALEIYLPVPEHRDAWEGGGDVIVATTLHENADPYGVDPSGRVLDLSADTPPDTPTIVLVRAEAFAADGSPVQRSLRQDLAISAVQTCLREPCGDDGGTGGGGGDLYCDTPSGPDRRGIGIRERLFCIRYRDQNEGWPNGAPEFDIRLAGTEDEDLFAEVQGRRRVPDQVWDDVEEDEWTYIRLNLFDLDTDVGDRVRIQCYEDDPDGDDQLTVSGTTTFSIGPVDFEATFEDVFGFGDDPCGNYELLIKTSTGEFTTMRQDESAPDGTSELQWLTYGIDLTQ